MDKTFTFNVPCSMMYYIEAQTEKEAFEILQKKGGVDIKGELYIDKYDYKEAQLMEQFDEEHNSSIMFGVDNEQN